MRTLSQMSHKSKWLPFSCVSWGDSLPFSKGFFLPTVRDEGGAGVQHSSGDVEQAIGNRAKRAALAMASAYQGCVLRPANPVVLHGNPGPMVYGIGQTLMTSLSSNQDQALTRPLGHGSRVRRLSDCVPRLADEAT
jgi:hypothetical protein